MKKRLWTIPLALVGLTLAVSAFQQPDKKDDKKEEKKEEKVQTAELGKAAPDFTLKDLDGKTIKLSDYKGKFVVLEWFSPAARCAIGPTARRDRCASCPRR
jgi:cytochrome oxidase Cu insertion factor (SCO1/SenC/PrrC family)